MLGDIIVCDTGYENQLQESRISNTVQDSTVYKTLNDSYAMYAKKLSSNQECSIF